MNRVDRDSFAQRISVVIPDIPIIEQSLEELFEKLVRIFLNNQISSLDFYLACIGYYPDPVNLEKLQSIRRKASTYDDLCRFVESEIINGPIPSNKIFLRRSPKTNIMDVTQSLGLSFTSGIQRVVREIFRKNQTEVDLGVWEFGGKVFRLVDRKEELLYLAAENNIRSSNIVTINLYFWGENLFLFENLNWNRDILEKYLFLSKRLNITSLIYDTIPLNEPSYTDSNTRNNFPLYLKNVLTFSTHILGISETQVSMITNWAKFLGKSELSISLLPLGVSCSCDLLLKQDTIRPGYRRILIVGTFDFRKNFLAVFTCLSKIVEHVNLEVVFIGPGGGMEPELHSIIKYFRKRRSKNLSFRVLKNISDERLHREYILADFSIFLSFAEGYGLPVIESIHHLTPVVISNEKSVLEMAGQKGVVHLASHGVEELRAVILELCSNDDYLRRLKLECSLRMKDAFEWPVLSGNPPKFS
jgi:glycosyltransferase involved in cell wall biosynthesis